MRSFVVFVIFMLLNYYKFPAPPIIIMLWLGIGGVMAIFQDVKELVK